MRTNGQWRRIAGCALIVAVLDLVSKLLAERDLASGVELVGGARLVLSHNTGVAFGGLAGAPPAAVLALVLACIAGLIVAMSRGLLGGGPLALGLILGGAVANLADRLEGGGVTDFIDLGAWPSFNLADAALSVGIAVMLWRSLREPTPPATHPLGTSAEGSHAR